MSVFHDRAEALEHQEFKLGQARGRLAVTLDVLTDALVLVGQHGIYCQSARNPDLPAKDLQIVQEQIQGAKDLVRSVLEQLQAEKNRPAATGESTPRQT